MTGKDDDMDQNCNSQLPEVEFIYWGNFNMMMEKLLKKLENMDPEERSRIKQMLKDKESDVDMGWMYKADEPEAEEYLLGRRIDRHIEGEDDSEIQNDVPGAAFSDVIAKRADLDMQAKMREDPLFAIRAREEDAKKRLLQNPIKMKQLQKMIKRQEKEKKKKKKKKHKKKGSGSDDSSDSDDDLMKQYLAIVKKKKGSKSPKVDVNSLKKVLEQSDSDSGSEHDTRHRRDGKYKTQASDSDSDRGYSSKVKGHHKVKSRSKSRQDSSSEEEASKPYGLIIKGESHNNKQQFRQNSQSPHRHNSHRKRSRSPKRRSKSPKRRSRSPKRRSRSPKRRSRSPVKRSYSPKRRSRSPRRRSRSPRRRSRSPRQTRRPDPPPRAQPKKKLSAEEMERKREEMMQNAKWRDEKRQENVKRYKDEDEKEKKNRKDQEKDSADFVNPMMALHASQSSVEERIKRNIYNVQRTKADLEKAFTKR